MRILLFGTTGQVGWELRRALQPLGAVTAVSRDEADFDRPESLRTCFSSAPDVIVNAVAYTAVDLAETDTESAMRVNAEAVAVLADEAFQRGALLIHYSTDYVFDGTGPVPYTEDNMPNPQSAYGRSKLAGEQAIAASGCDYVHAAHELGLRVARQELRADHPATGRRARDAAHRRRPVRGAHVGAADCRLHSPDRRAGCDRTARRPLRLRPLPPDCGRPYVVAWTGVARGRPRASGRRHATGRTHAGSHSQQRIPGAGPASVELVARHDAGSCSLRCAPPGLDDRS